MTKKRRAISTLVSLIIILSVVVGIYAVISKPAKAAWWNDSWTYRQKTTITNSGSAQTDFQVSITMSTTALVSAGKMQTDCDDIRLTDNTGNLLPIWIEPTTCNGASTKFWTKIPAIPVGTSTIYIYYGNSSATSISGTGSVFIRDIDQVQGAWTLDEASNTRADSSGNSYTLTDNSTVGSTTGQYSNAARFVRTSSEYLSRADNANLSINDQSFSTAFWVRFTTITNTMTIISKQHSGGAGEFRLDYEQSSGKLQGYIFNSSDSSIASIGDSTTISSGVWYHVVFGYNSDTRKLFIFVNGNLVEGVAQSSGVIPDSTDEFRLGQANDSAYLDGDLDEVTFYKQAITDQGRVNDLKNTGYRGYFSTNYANHQLLQKYASTAPSSGTPATEEISTGPMAHWKMDEGTDNTCSGGSNDTCNSTGVTALDGANTSVTWQTEDKCISGKCEFFNGSTSYVKVSDSTAFRPTNITLSAWVRVNANTGDYDFISKQYSTSTNISYLLKLNSGVPQFSVCNTAASCATTSSAGTALPTNQWFHLVGTYDGTTAKLYQNGQLIKQTAASITIGYDTNPIFLGARSIDATVGTPDYAFVQGFIDDVKVFAYAQTAIQVKADYASRGSIKGTSVALGLNKDNHDSLSNGLTGYWTLDEASGNATDYSGNSSSLTDTNTVTRVSGKFGNAADIDGSADYLTTAGDNTSLSTGDIDFSISGWVNADTLGSFRVIAAKYETTGNQREYGLAYDSTATKFRFFVSPDGSGTLTNIYSDITPVISTWYFIVAWHDSVNNTLNIQVNDGKINSVPYSDGVFDSTARFSVGSYNAGSSFWDGKIDDVRFYRRVLSGTDRSALYNWAPGPIGYWKIDENTGTSAYDSSANSNTGTKTNGSWGSGKYSSGLQSTVNSTQERISAGDVAAFDFSNTQSFSFGMWAKRTNAGSIMMLSKGGGANNDDGYDIETSGSAASCYYTDGNGSGSEQTTGTTNILDGAWHHIFCVMDRAAGTYSVYVDGVKEGTDSSLTEGSAASNTSGFIIGEIDASSEIDGTLDEVKIYNYARNTKQIVEDMNGGHPTGGSPVGSQLAYLKLDEQQGTVANNSGSQTAISGTLTGSPTWKTAGSSSCKISGCIDFDGSDDVVNLSSPTDLDDVAAFSISAWINPDSAGEGSNGRIAEKSGGWLFYHPGSATSLGLYVNYNSAASSLTCSADGTTTGAWQHVVVTWDGTSSCSGVSFYINGVKKYINSSVTPTGSRDSDAAGSLYVGNNAATDRTYDGKIDEFKFYNSVLTPDEVKIDYNAGSVTAMGGVLGTQDNEGTGGNPPAAYWMMDENKDNTCSGGTNDACDSSGNGSDAAFTGGVVWGNGKAGSALSLDGVNDYAQVTDNNNIDFATGSFTIEAWIKNNGNDDDFLFYKRAGADNLGYTIYIGPSGRIRFQYGDGTTVVTNTPGTTDVSDDSWHFVVMTVNKSTNVGRIYVDNIQEGSDISISGITGSASTATNLFIGSDSSGAWFTGLIDNVRFYNYLRSSSQLAYDMNRGAPAAHYKFDECQGTTVYNSALAASGLAAGTNGTITPAAGTNTSAGSCGSGTSSEMWNDGTTGKINGSLGFDGSDDYVDMGDPSNGLLDFGTGDFSISLWVNPAAANGVLVTKGGNAGGTVGSRSGYYMYIESDRTVRVEVNSYDDNAKWNQIKTVNTIPLNSWSQLTYVKTSTEASFYINGVKQLVTSSSDPISQITTTSTAASFLVGTYFPLATYFNGQIDELRVYNYALSANQIKTIVNNGAVFFGPATGSP